MSRSVRLALFCSIVFSSIAVVFACSAPAPSLDESNNTKDDAGKKKSDAAPKGPSSTEPPDPLPPPTPPVKDGGGNDSATNDSAPGPTNPPPTPFLMLDVRYPVDANRYVTQCTPDGKSQLVWTTTDRGLDENSRFANASYKENPGTNYPCGTIASGEHPIVLSWLPPDGVPVGTWIVRCAGNKTSQVYRVTTTHAGHPAATYQYPETYAACP